MKKYYKVELFSKYVDLSKYNTNIIVEKGLIYAKEVITGTRIMICDNDFQGSLYDYYVYTKDFNLNNLARITDLKEYRESFNLEEYPIYNKLEVKESKKLIRTIKKEVHHD